MLVVSKFDNTCVEDQTGPIEPRKHPTFLNVSNVGCLPRVSGMGRVKNLTHRKARTPLELFVLSST